MIRKSDIEAIRNSEHFDAEWYLKTYPDVRVLGLDPAEHYLWFGARLNRRPSPRFDGELYLAINSDVKENGMNPLLHYERWGKQEARGLPEMYSSTYPATRAYAFTAPESLEAQAEEYVRHRLLNGMRPAKIAMFTAISGGYETVRFHEHLMDAADYYVFTDTGLADCYVYKVRRIPYFDQDPVRMARFVKTHAHMLLAQYAIAVWVDGSMLIRGDLSGLIDSFDRSGLPLGAVPHPLRSSVYEEAQACMTRAKDDPATIEKQVGRYRSEGFDCHDLIETGLMMFRLDHPQLGPFLSTWWAEIERGSRRDQLSINYALQKTGAEWFPLTTKRDSVRNHPGLALFDHGSHQSPYVPRAAFAADREPCYAEVMDERLARQTDKTADVIVCVHDALEVVDPCLRSVIANRDVERHRIVIVDDGSKDETAAWLCAFAAEHANVDLVRHGEALGYTKAANAGLQGSQADMAILLNSDTIVAGRWIDKLLDAAFATCGVGIAGPLSSAASHQSIPDHRSTDSQTAVNPLPDGYSVAAMNEWCERHSPADFVPRVPLVHGFCFAVTRALIEAIGHFDEANFPLGYGEENDYCFRAVDAGFSLAVATHTYVYHKKSQSYQGNRLALAKAGIRKIRELHGEERVSRAVRNMEANPHLERIRALAAELFVDRRPRQQAR